MAGGNPIGAVRRREMMLNADPVTVRVSHGGLLDQIRFCLQCQMAGSELEAGDAWNILEREIATIQEILDEQPYSECQCLSRSQLRYSSFQPTNTHRRVHGVARLLQEASSEEIQRYDD